MLLADGTYREVGTKLKKCRLLVVLMMVASMINKAGVSNVAQNVIEQDSCRGRMYAGVVREIGQGNKNISSQMNTRKKHLH